MSVDVSASRTYPIERARAFDVVLPLPLPRIFTRRYGPFPPIKRVSDDGRPWAEVGQTRRIHLSDGGSMTETLTVVEPPYLFGYRIDDVAGPLALLVEEIEGRWAFDEVGTGTRITWGWTLHPRGRVGALALPPIARLWGGYARQALEELERVLAP